MTKQTEEARYECPECHWVGTTGEMAGDHYCGTAEEGEVWSNRICPDCGFWFVSEDHDPPEAFLAV